MAKELLASSGIRVDFRTDGAPRTIDTFVEENLLRIAQESLNNALRHAGARRVEIVLGFESAALTLRVGDDGRGFDTTRRTAGPGFGLVSMQERAELIGADLTVTSHPGSGTEVTVWVPDSVDPQPG
jgi:signal transduction histidine kinase